jgi:hypothetical protein
MTNPPDQNALNSRNSTASVATRSETDAYLASIRNHRTSVGTGRLIFALDATASRRPTWSSFRPRCSRRSKRSAGFRSSWSTTAASMSVEPPSGSLGPIISPD